MLQQDEFFKINKSNYCLTKIPREVFRAYDIRGVIGKDLNENSFYSLGKTIAVRLKELNRSSIVVARDVRLTSESLTCALIHGLIDSAIEVVDLGVASTPVMYFATHVCAIDSGLMVTGSHNSKEFNGLKIVLAGTTLANDDINLLYQINQESKYLNECGKYRQYNILNEYIEYIVNNINLKKSLKIVIDCGNGVAGPIVTAVLKKLNCEIIELYCEPDGNFPNHHPDPTIEKNLIDLKKSVIANNADLGLAFDGDGDRLGVVTNTGELIWPDRIMMLYARHLLQTNPGAAIVYDVKCSYNLKKVIEQNKGISKMCPTGHSIVKAKMREEHAILAGEMSGHIFFKDRWFGFDDALYSACRLLEIISLEDTTVSQQFKKIPDSVNTPEIKIAMQDKDKFNFVASFIENSDFPDGEKILIDGIRVEFEHGWGLLRASNTSPCLVARFEAQDDVTLLEIQAQFKKQLYAINANLNLEF